MSETSKYWYKKVDIPDNAKDKISRMVKGEKVAEFEIGGGGKTSAPKNGWRCFP